MTNKKTISGLVYLLAIFLIAFNSCKKRDIPPSALKLLTNDSQKEWTNISQTRNGVENLADCDKDNIFTFYRDGTLALSEGFLRCNVIPQPFVAQFVPGTLDNKKFYVQTNKEIQRADIITLTEDQFTFQIVTESKYGDATEVMVLYFVAKK